MYRKFSPSLRRFKYFRIFWTIFSGASYFFVLNGSTCATVDPPPPDPLAAPQIIKSGIYCAPSSSGFREMIHLQWEKPDRDDISISEYRVIRRVQGDDIGYSFKIPPQASDFFDPTDELDVSRLQTQSIYYQLYAVDHLERQSDTSIICTVSLAPSVRLISPSNILKENRFEWSIYNVAQTCLSELFLYRGDLLLWQSGPVGGYHLIGSDREKTLSVSLPDSVYVSLKDANFEWAVKLQVVGAGDPASITIKPFSVGIKGG